MAAITSNGTGGGLASATATWTGGVVPVSGDSVEILAGDIVEVDGTYEWGDDTSLTAVVVNGSLKFSRTVSTSLTIVGDIYIYGDLDLGKEADPILLPITCELVLGKAAVPTDGKYDLQVEDAASFSAWGSDKVRIVDTTANILAGDSTVPVSDTTGWQVGDVLAIAWSNDIPGQQESMVIQADFTAGDLILTHPSTLTYAHPTPCILVNVTSNVVIRSFDVVNGARVYLNQDHLTTVPNSRELGCMTFLDMCDVYPSYGVYFIQNSSNYGSTETFQPYRKLYRVSFTETPGSGLGRVTKYQVNQTKEYAVFEECVFITNFDEGTANKNNLSAGNAIMLNCAFGMYKPPDHWGKCTPIFDNCKFLSVTYQTMTSVQECVIKNSIKIGITGYTLILAGVGFAYNKILFEDCDISSTNQSSRTDFHVLYCQQYGALIHATVKNCLFYPGIDRLMFSQAHQNNMSDDSYLKIINYDKDPTKQIEVTRYGQIDRENIVQHRSSSSIMLRGNYVDTPYEKSFSVNILSGVTYRVIGYMRYNTDLYNGGVNFVAPKVEIKLGGVILASFTMSANIVDTWEQFDLTFSQSTGSARDVDVVITMQYPLTTGRVYFDGVPYPPFVDKCRHYGFVIDETSPVRKIDPLIVATEAIAIAYTGCTVNDATKELSFSAGTIDSYQKLYDYVMAFVCENLDVEIPFTRAGSLFSITSGWVVIEPTLDNTWDGGAVQWDSTGVKSGAFSGNQFIFTTVGSYDFGSATFTGTVELVNVSGGLVDVALPAGTTYVNTGPDITITVPIAYAPISITAKALNGGAVIPDATVYLIAEAGGDLVIGTEIIKTTTDVNGNVTVSDFVYTNDQPVSGTIRKGTTSPLYKPSPFSGVIASSGLSITQLMIGDE